MTTALTDRGVPGPTTHLASELGVLAFKQGYAEWSHDDGHAEDELAPFPLNALHQLRAAAALLA